MFAILASETNFIMTPRILVMVVNISITLNSTVREIANYKKPIKKAGCTYVKLSLWLTAYFIIDKPYLTSFSTLMCISMDPMNLAHIISRPVAGKMIKSLLLLA